MPGESPTKWQAQAYRFGVRRLESAVSDGDALLRGDRMRRRLNLSLIISFIIAALVLGAFAVYGFVRPAPKIGNASVVIDSDTGGVFVSRDGRLYPAMNLASALLAAGRGQSGNNAPSTTTVDTAAVAKEPRGPLLGIPGAPDVLPAQSKLVQSTWTVCDQTTIHTALPPGSPPTLSTTAIIGEKRPVVGSLGTTRAMLVSADKGATTYLVWHGTRARIDLSDNAIRLAFSLPSDVSPRPISPAVLNLIPQGPNISVPAVKDAGSHPSWLPAQLGISVGDVFALRRADGSRTVFVALYDGKQAISPLVGDLIRAEFDVTKNIPLVAPKLLRALPTTQHALDISIYPSRHPKIVSITDADVACVYRAGTDPKTTDVIAQRRVPVPGKAKPVTVTRPSAMTVDAVYVRPGRGAVFSTSTASQRSGAGAWYVVTDEGMAYPVPSTKALAYLGLDAHVHATAPALLNLLPQGPVLDPDAAVHFYPQTGPDASGLPAPSSSAANAP